MAKTGWLRTMWLTLDKALRDVSGGLQAKLRKLRQLRAILLTGVIAALALGAGAAWRPELAHYLLAGAIVFLILPHIYLYVILSFPLKAQSVVRLIDQGYPANAREIGIRVVAQKLHDESIETEELLVDTAWNEAKKAYRKYKEKASDLGKRLDREDGGGDQPPRDVGRPPAPPVREEGDRR